jgi:CheY-like chemotaxis protein
MDGAIASDGSRGNILIVDDSPMNVRILERALREEGYESKAANNGREALDALHAGGRPFDVVLLDIVMPAMDGYEALATIKGDDQLKHIPVIMITSVEETESTVRCIELGATDYLTKPFNAPVLRARIGASMAEKRLRDLERAYLEQVEMVTGAAVAIGNGNYDLDALNVVSRRTDALGETARVIRKMAQEVKQREALLREQVRELRIEVDEARQHQKVQEITSSDFFKDLMGRASELRRTMSDGPFDPAAEQQRE